jgi:hypothetical protein
MKPTPTDPRLAVRPLNIHEVLRSLINHVTVCDWREWDCIVDAEARMVIYTATFPYLKYEELRVVFDATTYSSHVEWTLSIHNDVTRTSFVAESTDNKDEQALWLALENTFKSRSFQRLDNPPHMQSEDAAFSALLSVIS